MKRHGLKWAVAGLMVASPCLARAQGSASALSQAQIEQSSREAVARANEQQTKLVLVGGEIGWIKYCEAQGDRCILVRGFGPGPIYPSKLQLTIETTKQNDLYRVRLLLPLNLQLDAGFAVSFGTPSAYVGAFKVCSTSGCFGDIFLPQADFDGMKGAKVVDVVVKTDVGRTVMVEGPMDGFAAALGKTPDKPETVLAKEEDINKRLAAEIDANRVARETAERAAAAKDAASPPSASQASGTAAR